MSHGAGADGDGVPSGGFGDLKGRRPRTESLGEALLGSMIDRAHVLPPRLVAPMVAQEIVAAGGRDVVIYLQDFDQVVLQPLRGEGLAAAGPLRIDGSLPGRAFGSDGSVEQPQPDGSTRLLLSMLDGTDRVGVLAFTLPRVDDTDRRLAKRLAGLVADLVVTKGHYTDVFFTARASQPMSLPAQLQRQLLPPLTMTTPRLSVAGILEPAYEVGGDSFDYALNHDVLSVAIIDAMGHGLDAATMATVAVGAYRHARRAGVDLADLYTAMDAAVSAQFGPDRFASAQMGELDTSTGVLTWVNAGHPAPLLVRGRQVVQELAGPTTLPVGFGGAAPQVQSVALHPGDRVLFFTDGLVEERLAATAGQDRQEFGAVRLRDFVDRASSQGASVPETVRRLSRSLMQARGGQTSDDATLLMVQWTGPPGDEDLLGEVAADLTDPPGGH